MILTIEELCRYMKELSLNMNDARSFARKLVEIKNLRNEAAHGRGILDINKAKKAQDVAYNHDPSPDASLSAITIAQSCHKVIIDMLRWFAKGDSK